MAWRRVWDFPAEVLGWEGGEEPLSVLPQLGPDRPETGVRSEALPRGKIKITLQTTPQPQIQKNVAS